MPSQWFDLITVPEGFLVGEMDIKYFNEDTSERILGSKKKFNVTSDVYVGNEIGVYRNEKERTLFNFMIKSSVLSNFISYIIDNNLDNITILDLGCGNGSNSRVMSKFIIDNFSDKVKVKIIYVDVSSELLLEAGARTNALVDSLSVDINYELVQVDFRDDQSICRFSEEYENTADFIFSIKFFHNTPLKIDYNKAKMISTICKKKCVFLCQFYLNTGWLRNVKSFIKLILNIPYENSIFTDRYFANKNLREQGFYKEYCVRSTACGDALSYNHFTKSSMELYWVRH